MLQDRTFADPAAEIYLTPVARGGTGADRWFDVAVMLEPASANDAPSLSVSASALQVAPGQLVDFSATAQDPNGDSLAYFWDLTEGQSLSGTNRAARTWSRAGDFIVRCEVSDRRGGLASTNLVIRVGNPGTGRITGRVVDTSGRGLQGCRVHTGRVDYFPWDRPDFFAERVTRRRFAVHAEINALRWTTPRDVAGGLLAVTHHPCGECVRTAAGYGIKEIVWAEPLDWGVYNRREIEAVADACQVTLQRCVPNS